MNIETLKKANKLEEEIRIYENAEFIFQHARDAIINAGCARYFRLSPDTNELRDAVVPVIHEILERKRQELAEL